MKTKPKLEPRRFELRQLGFDDEYYLTRLIRLEETLAEQPELFQIDILGECAIPADTALLIRSILRERSPYTKLITNARSSLCGGSVLIWLQGDVRLIRDDAKVFFRRVDKSELGDVKLVEPWKDLEDFDDSDSEASPAEDEYARVLEHINEYLPVKEMAGRMIGVPVLRQFGLVDNESMDQLLNSTLGKSTEHAKSSPDVSDEKLSRSKSKLVLPESQQN